MRKALKAKLDSHSNILRGFSGGEADGETKKMLGTLAEDIGALRARAPWRRCTNAATATRWMTKSTR